MLVIVFPQGKEKSASTKKSHKMVMRVSEPCVSVVYDLPPMYFISFSLGTTKYCQ